MQTNSIFERTEKKYILTVSQMKELILRLDNRITKDKFFESTVRSIYFDTDDYRLIRNSIDKPVYKEKLRLRSYTDVVPDSTVFLELKKKYKGIVYKRREKLTYLQAENYINTHKLPKKSQIMCEIDYAMNYYNNLKPRMCIFYDRKAYCGVENTGLRITFDTNLRYRTDRLDLTADTNGDLIINSDMCIMEIKALGAMPLFLTELLTQMKIRPGSFSKYGTAYKIIKQNKNNKGGINCA